MGFRTTARRPALAEARIRPTFPTPPVQFSPCDQAAKVKSGSSMERTVARKWILEHHTVKVLVEPQGAIVAFTMKTYSYLFLVSKRFVGVKRIRTADRIVAKAEYSTPRVLEMILRMYPHGP